MLASPMWAPVHALATLLQVYRPVNSLENAMEEVIEPLLPMWEPCFQFLLAQDIAAIPGVNWRIKDCFHPLFSETDLQISK